MGGSRSRRAQWGAGGPAACGEGICQPNPCAAVITRGVIERVLVQGSVGHQGGHAQNVRECGAVWVKIGSRAGRCSGDTWRDPHHLCRVRRRSAPGQTPCGLPGGAGGRVLAVLPAELHHISSPAGSRREGDTAATWELRKRFPRRRAHEGSVGWATRCCSRLADRPPCRGGAHAAKRGAETERRCAWERMSCGRRKHHPLLSYITPPPPPTLHESAAALRSAVAPRPTENAAFHAR